ncbi:MAG: molybdopterin-dependent oxidoreductase [Dehalococcoidia bacterium]
MEAPHRGRVSRSRNIRRTAGTVAAALLIALIPAVTSAQSGEPLPADLQGFPAWLRVTHFVNFLFMTLIIRAGLQILVDHPRLYWNVDCTPDSEWIRFTPVKVPKDRVWTAKDDARYLTPIVGIPGGRHTVGMARHWHFFSVTFWVLNGVIFLVLLFGTGQWQRLAPTSWSILPDAWDTAIRYIRLDFHSDPDAYYYGYNGLQQLAYFAVVFILAPLALLTGAAISPAMAARFPWYPRLFGNRQVARSIHFLVLCAFLAFVAIHVTMAALTGLTRNMNHIVLGTDDTGAAGLWIGLIAVGIVIAVNIAANVVSRRAPRFVQHVSKYTVTPLMSLIFSRMKPRAEYRRDQISPYFWPNGKLPVSDDWKSLATDGFDRYRLKVYGLVGNPVELSLEEIRALGMERHTTLHNCIQGWSGIAEWGGLPMHRLIALVKPHADARYAVFYSYGEGGEGGEYYDSHTMEDILHPQSQLAYEMDYQPLSLLHGAPLRLRVENQLGFKQVKWIKFIEFVESRRSVFKGEGG